MKVYVISAIHGRLTELEEALVLVLEHLKESNTKLVLLGYYVHGGADNRGVLDRIMSLQQRYGSDKVVALLGNHDECVLNDIDYTTKAYAQSDDYEYDDIDDDRYIQWLETLPAIMS